MRARVRARVRVRICVYMCMCFTVCVYVETCMLVHVVRACVRAHGWGVYVRARVRACVSLPRSSGLSPEELSKLYSVENIEETSVTSDEEVN